MYSSADTSILAAWTFSSDKQPHTKILQTFLTFKFILGTGRFIERVSSLNPKSTGNLVRNVAWNRIANARAPVPLTPNPKP